MSSKSYSQLKNSKWKPDPYKVEFIFRTYRMLEEKIIDILNFLPFTRENEKSWSPELANLFLDVSSLFDSICRYIISKGREEGKILIREKTKEGIKERKRDIKKLNIEHFELNLLSPFKILNSRVVFYRYPLIILSPFKRYRTDGWWKVYNRLKHDRIYNFKQANLKNTLYALASLFLLLCKYKEEEFTKALVRFGWYNSSIVPEYVYEERTRESWKFWYDSNLFGTHEISKNLPNDLSKINPVITSDKFRKYWGKFNP